jgi:hypothetical protein
MTVCVRLTEATGVTVDGEFHVTPFVSKHGILLRTQLDANVALAHPVRGDMVMLT